MITLSFFYVYLFGSKVYFSYISIMKRLFKYDRGLEFFFDSSTTIEKIQVWVIMKIDLLEPNEAHSCTVEIHDENTILISGDEDSIELEIREVEVIKC